jgi:hypothetical protein
MPGRWACGERAGSERGVSREGAKGSWGEGLVESGWIRWEVRLERQGPLDKGPSIVHDLVNRELDCFCRCSTRVPFSGARCGDSPRRDLRRGSGVGGGSGLIK